MSDHVSTASTNWGRDKAGPRTVAVVLGWQRRMQMIDGRETTSPSSHWFHPAHPKRFVDEPTVTPDDMLAWLLQRYSGVDIYVNDTYVALEPWPHLWPFMGATLHSALEAAVLAVDEAER